MFDDDGDFPELDSLEAAWAASDPAPKPKVRARPGKLNPNWQPRVKGAKVDQTSKAYLAEKDAASYGLPHFSRMQWLQVQMMDHGENPKVHHALKMEAVDAPLSACTRQGLRAMARVRWCNLSEPKNFKTNIRKRKWRDAKANADGPIKREVIPEECWAPALRWIEMAEEANAVLLPLGAPTALCGYVSFPFEGTQTYAGQFGLVVWEPGEDGAWLPTVAFSQMTGDGRGGWHDLVVPMRVPSLIKRDGTPRSAIAQARYPFIGTWFSDALQERITVGREIKAMRKADMKARGIAA